jgi:hypothetical protein
MRIATRQTPEAQSLLRDALERLTELLGEAPEVVEWSNEASDIGDGITVRCTYRGHEELYSVTLTSRLSSYRLLERVTRTPPSDSDNHTPLPLIATSHVTDRAAIDLRSKGLQYVDSLGNAHLHFGPVLIDVRGRRAPKPQSELPRGARGSASLTSPRRAQIIMCLLAWPDLLQARLQDLADASGTSPSQVHQTIKLLSEAGYVSDKELYRHRTPELLDMWASAYATQLGPTLALDEFTSQHPGEWPALPDGLLAHRSGESAAHTLMRPTTATIYLETPDPALIRLNRWMRTERPNVFLRLRFWTSPEEGTRTHGTHEAPWPIVYADLLSSNDPRHREAAQNWRQARER